MQVFFFNDTATTEIYTLSLHDALPISTWTASPGRGWTAPTGAGRRPRRCPTSAGGSSTPRTGRLPRPCAVPGCAWAAGPCCTAAAPEGGPRPPHPLVRSPEPPDGPWRGRRGHGG